MIIDSENNSLKKPSQDEMYKFLVKRFGRDENGKPQVAKILIGTEPQRLDLL